MKNYINRFYPKVIRLIKRLFGNVENSQLDSTSYQVFKALKKGSIAIDCGANVGVVTEKMAQKGATVYAFEPNPYAFKKLEQKFIQNNRVHCLQKGVLDKETTLKLHLHENSDKDEVYWSTGSSFLAYKGNVLIEKFVEVPVVDLSQFIKELNSRVALLKLDVEGVEIEVLNKLIDTKIIHAIDKVVVETHEKKIPELLHKTNQLRARIKREGLHHIDLNWI